MGTSRAFDELGADVAVTLVEPAESPVLTEGHAGGHAVEGTAIVGSPPLVERDRYDGVCTLPSEEGVEAVRDLARNEGLLVGTSSGMNVAAARRVAAERDPDDVVVTVACDTGLKYLSGGLFEGLGDTSVCIC